MEKRKSRYEHDSLVKTVAQILVGRGYSDVKADIEGYTPPKKIVWETSREGFVPDVTAQRDELRIFEVETVDTMSAPHTEEQWKLFFAYAKANKAMFYIVFPKGSVDAVKKRLEEIGISAYLWEI